MSPSRFRVLLLTAGAIASCAVIAAPANAAILVFSAPLTGAAENPDVVTTGTGLVTVTIDDVLNTIRIQAAFSRLSAPTSVAHIHCCTTPDMNAGVAVGPGTLPGFPVGALSGTYDSTLDLLSSGTYTPGFINNTIFGGSGSVLGARNAIISGISGGRSYFNIHTTAFPGGEIRGQLAAVPEPASWALMLAGFGLTGMAIRRRRRLAPA